MAQPVPTLLASAGTNTNILTRLKILSIMKPRHEKDLDIFAIINKGDGLATVKDFDIARP
jgi:hypothetical protein